MLKIKILTISLCYITVVNSSNNCVLPQIPKGTKVTCELNGSLVDCTQRPHHGTRAKVECDTFYENSRLNESPYRFCIDGFWDDAWPKCEPVCGLKTGGEKLLVNSTNVTKSDYPWQVSVRYSGSLRQFCGGSIISPRLTLSAAHCFKLRDATKYILAAGKYYRDFNDSRDIGAQYTKISHLIIHSNYDPSPIMAYDLAILVHKTPFIMNKFVLPVCFASNINFDYSTLIGKTGIFTGWGCPKRYSPSSKTLKQIEMKYYSKATCQLNKSNRPFYLPNAPDKLCAGFLHEGKIVCYGDSGGPLVFLGENERYFIRGINSLVSNLSDTTQLSLLTAIPYHNDFIKKIKRQYPS